MNMPYYKPSVAAVARAHAAGLTSAEMMDKAKRGRRAPRTVKLEGVRMTASRLDDLATLAEKRGAAYAIERVKEFARKAAKSKIGIYVNPPAQPTEREWLGLPTNER